VPDLRSSAANRALATELRRLRELARMSGDEVASALRWSASKVSRIETNRIGIKPADLNRLLDLYLVDDARRAQLVALAGEPELSGWWSGYGDSIATEYMAYISLEASAAKLRFWSPELIHGLLQTEEYAQAVMDIAFGSPPLLPWRTIQDRIEVRMRRQSLLTSGTSEHFTFILDEGTLLRRHGSSQVMRDQLSRLDEVSRLPDVTLRVLAFDGAHPLVMQGSFAVLEFAPIHGIDIRDVVYVEELAHSDFIDDEPGPHEYRLAFERLADVALDPDESRALIARTRSERWS
jgi:transcriptional regulator with XRE-family HTH domain